MVVWSRCLRSLNLLLVAAEFMAPCQLYRYFLGLWAQRRRFSFFGGLLTVRKKSARGAVVLRVRPIVPIKR